MNPNAPQPSFELPTPQPVQGGETTPQPFEQQPVSPEMNTKPAAPPLANPIHMPQSQASAQAIPAPLQTQTTQTSSANPVVADDTDLIEKEWVVKAKQIVAATREDPHLQNKEMSRFKADYLKKRYNKDIKLEES